MGFFSHFMFFDRCFFGLPLPDFLVESLLEKPVGPKGEDKGVVDDSGPFLNGGVMLLTEISIIFRFFLSQASSPRATIQVLVLLGVRN